MDQRERLGQLISAYRKRRGLSIRAAADAAGIDRDTWTSAEKGTKRTAEYIYGPIERVLGWAPGSVDQILGGGEPTELPEEQAWKPAPQQPKRERERDEEIEIVLADDTLDNEMKMEIIELIYERRKAERAASIKETRKMIDLFKRRRSA
ncbi:helix-turn-helix domain-containing protein [Micromonospora sp. NPDC048930]|uniref:helix-turn-helix domain-containing protein n=1 Tax=Micromonospora sp. NPDC048930 TaxID=3364261 RepID=UPI00371A444D